MSYVKCVQSGDLIEIYSYARSPSPNRLHRVPKTRQQLLWDSNKPRRLRRRDNLVKTKQSFRRLVRSSLQKGNPALLTLTMLTVLDYPSSVRLFTSFGQRLKRVFGQHIDWVAVAEFQRRGALHFHALVWGLTDHVISSERSSRYLQNIWGYGYVDIVPTDGSPKLASYLGKYMSKSMQDSRLVGKRAYCASRGVLRPVSFTSPAAVDFILEEVIDIPPLQSREYDTMWLGRANYKSYSLQPYGKY